MAESTMPRYLTAFQASLMKRTIDRAITKAHDEAVGSDCDPRAVDHELGMMLARAACRFDLDLLSGATQTIERLEAVVAELEARLSQAKIATGHVETPIASRVQRVGNGDAYRYMSPEQAQAALHENGSTPHPDGCRCGACRA